MNRRGRWLGRSALLMIGLWCLPSWADESRPTMGYRDGFFVESADGNYRLHVQGRLQARWTYNRLESTADTHTFAIPNGKLVLSGHVVRPTFRYGLQFGFATRNPAGTTTVCTNAACTTTATAVTSESTTGLATLDDFWFDWVPRPEFGIKVGQFKVPFLSQEIISEIKLQLVDRSLAHSVFTLGRDLGLSVHGRAAERFHYAVFLMNGDGVNTINRNTSYLVGTRLTLQFLGDPADAEADPDYSESPQWGMSAAYVFNRPGAASQGGSVAAGLRTSLATVDTTFRYRGLFVTLAGMYGRSHDAPTVTNWGYHGQIGYTIVPKRFEIAARAAGVIFRGTAPDPYEYSLGANYYVKGHALKLQTDYAFLPNARGQDLNDHRIRTQMQVVF